MSRFDYSCSFVIGIPRETSLAQRATYIRTELASPIAKSTSPGLSDITFFARYKGLVQKFRYLDEARTTTTRTAAPAAVVVKSEKSPKSL